VQGFLKILRDCTQQRADNATLHTLQDQLRLAVQATDLGIFDYDLVSGDLGWDTRVRTLFGLPPNAAVTYEAFLAALHPDDRVPVDQAVKAALDPAGGGTYDIAYRTVGLEDGRERWVAAKGQVFFANGRAVRFIGTVRDISEIKRTEEHQRLLTGELQHRIKNTLAMVQAIANQTLRGATDIDEAREAFAGRLISLGRAHDILTQVSWTAAPIAEVIEGALCVHRLASVPRIRISGPNVLLAAKPALSLALALHELATNAAKYGALSNADGFVDLRWRIVQKSEQPRFRLTWSEQGGPPIRSQPARRGFGSRLIERSFSSEVGGEVKLTYAATGLVCRLEAPLAAMQEQQAVAVLQQPLRHEATPRQEN
jgi:PAS domain S-box-containing protein